MPLQFHICDLNFGSFMPHLLNKWRKLLTKKLQALLFEPRGGCCGCGGGGVFASAAACGGGAVFGRGGRCLALGSVAGAEAESLLSSRGCCCCCCMGLRHKKGLISLSPIISSLGVTNSFFSSFFLTWAWQSRGRELKGPPCARRPRPSDVGRPRSDVEGRDQFPNHDTEKGELSRGLAVGAPGLLAHTQMGLMRKASLQRSRRLHSESCFPALDQDLGGGVKRNCLL